MAGNLFSFLMWFLYITAPADNVTGHDTLDALKSHNKTIVIRVDVKKYPDFSRSTTTTHDK